MFDSVLTADEELERELEVLMRLSVELEPFSAYDADGHRLPDDAHPDDAFPHDAFPDDAFPDDANLDNRCQEKPRPRSYSGTGAVPAARSAGSQPDPLTDPGAAVRALVDLLAGMDCAQAPDTVLFDALVAIQQSGSWLSAREADLITELDARRVQPAAHRAARATTTGADPATVRRADREHDMACRALTDEIALTLGWSQQRAERRHATVLSLTGELPATYEALRTGHLETRKADVIVETLTALPQHLRASSDAPAPEDQQTPVLEELREQIEAEVLPIARQLNLPALREYLTRAMLRALGAQHDRNAKAEREDRRVTITPREHDMAELWAYLPADDAARIEATLQSACTLNGVAGDGRTAQQRRADALVDLITEPADVTDATRATRETRETRDDQGSPTGADGDSGLTRTDPDGRIRPTARRRADLRTEVVVTIPLSTLLARDDEPAMLARYGPIGAETARRMASDAAANGTFRCAIVDDVHGTLLGLGTSTYTPRYRPGDRLTRHLIVRDQTCRFPGCRNKAVLADIDHRRPHPHGPTCECNTACYCRHHHRIKHETPFTVSASDDPTDPPGTHLWTTPTGRTYAAPPPTLPTTPGIPVIDHPDDDPIPF